MSSMFPWKCSTLPDLRIGLNPSLVISLRTTPRFRFSHYHIILSLSRWLKRKYKNMRESKIRPPSFAFIDVGLVWTLLLSSFSTPSMERIRGTIGVIQWCLVGWSLPSVLVITMGEEERGMVGVRLWLKNFCTDLDHPDDLR